MTRNPKKILLVVIDGLGDMPIKELDNKTPLGAAKTPNFDIIATRSQLGLINAYIGKSGLPTSEESHLALFGYDPKRFNIGRGVFEALGIGMKVRPNDICFRGNFATVNGKNVIVDRRAGRIEDSTPLVKAISNIKISGVRFMIRRSVSHRIGIVLRGTGLSKDITGNDPKKTGVSPLVVVPLKDSKKAKFTAGILNQFLEKTRTILLKHPSNRNRKIPANSILIRGAGEYLKLPAFTDRFSIKACAIAGGPVYKGIAGALGMKIVNVKGATALPNTNIKGKIDATIKALKKYDFVFLHIKATDSLAEDGDYAGKRQFIEKIDKQFKSILKIQNAIVVITSDHSACSILKKHCIEPCPLMVYNPTIGKIAVSHNQRFTEKDCRHGKLGIFPQIKLMPLIIMAKR